MGVGQARHEEPKSLCQSQKVHLLPTAGNLLGKPTSESYPHRSWLGTQGKLPFLVVVTNLPGDSDSRIAFKRHCLMRIKNKTKTQLLILAGYIPFGYFENRSLPA